MTQNSCSKLSLPTGEELEKLGKTNPLYTVSLTGKDFLKLFLSETRDWDKLFIAKHYLFKAKTAKELIDLLQASRVALSRARMALRAEGKLTADFRLISSIAYFGEPSVDELGYKTFVVSLAKACTVTRVMDKELENLLV